MRSKFMKKILIVLIILTFVFASCEGPMGPEGTEGTEGPQGLEGASVYIKDSINSVEELDPSMGGFTTLGNPPFDYLNAYLIKDTGELWVWDPSANNFVRAGFVLGEPGDKGPDGLPGKQGEGVILKTVTITFNYDGGSGEVASIVTVVGGKLLAPDPGIRLLDDFPLQGLYKTNDAQYKLASFKTDAGEVWDFEQPFTESITLKASWTNPTAYGVVTGAVSASNNVFLNAMNYLNTQTTSSEGWILYLNSEIDTNAVSIGADAKFDLTIIGLVGERKVNMAANGSLLTLGTASAGNRDIKVTLGRNVNLVGRSTEGKWGANNNAPLVVVNRAQFTMLENSKLTGNTSTEAVINTTAGGILVTQYGEFILDGGQVAGNKMTGGASNVSAGVTVYNGGQFTMSSGQITGNGTTVTGNNVSAGVTVTAGGKFTMSGGQITGNSFTDGTAYSSARGVAVTVTGANSVFEVSAGTFSSNTSVNNVGTVFVNSDVSANAFIIGGNVVIDSVTLYATSADAATGLSRITVASGWTGSIGAINLAGNNVDLVTNIGYWYNSNVANSRIVLTSDAPVGNRINPGNFIGSTLANTQDIGSTFSFERDGVNYKLKMD
jgi:hypothetical protein